MRSVEVISAGPLTTVQDLGRPGWAHIGVPRSGAADRSSLIRANRLVRNPPGAPALETTLVGPKLRVNADTIVALTGAPVNASVGERDVPMDVAVKLAAGDLLTVGTARGGLRTYVAFDGGIDAPSTLGSASTDLLSGLGPAPLARGDVLQITDPEQLVPERDQLVPEREQLVPEREQLVPASGVGAVDGPRCSGGPAHSTLRVVLGPRQDRFAADALIALVSEPFTVNSASNRIGVRLDGPALQRADTRELLSEGLVAGALQVPGDGQPILLLADHPTTGGYPVVAVVIEADLSLAAQLRPGRELRFSPVR